MVTFHPERISAAEASARLRRIMDLSPEERARLADEQPDVRALLDAPRFGSSGDRDV